MKLFAEKDKTEQTLDTAGNPRTKYIISYDEITEKVRKMIDGEIMSKQAFTTTDYDVVTHNQILEICKDRFSGYETRFGGKRVIEFIKEEVEKAGSVFDEVTEIEILESNKTPEDKEENSEVWADWRQSAEQQPAS